MAAVAPGSRFDLPAISQTYMRSLLNNHHVQSCAIHTSSRSSDSVQSPQCCCLYWMHATSGTEETSFNPMRKGRWSFSVMPAPRLLRACSSQARCTRSLTTGGMDPVHVTDVEELEGFLTRLVFGAPAASPPLHCITCDALPVWFCVKSPRHFL